MPDRLIRDELLESDRWLDLPTDASRLAFVGFLLICDDFGNFEGGARRLFRLLHKFTQIKTSDAAASTIDALMACDLIRRYEKDDRELFHIPRFKSHRQYLSRAYPASPWCTSDALLGKDKRVINKGLAKNVITTSSERSVDVAEGVGVGVGVRRKPSSTDVEADPWLIGKDFLITRGVSKSTVGSFLGKLVKDYGKPAVITALQSAIVNEPADVKSFIIGALRAKPEKFDAVASNLAFIRSQND